VFGLVLACAWPVSAHDSWLVASRNLAPQPGRVRVAFITSEHFPDSEYATKPERILEWTVRLGKSKRPVTGFRIEGKELAAQVPLDRPGVHVVAARLHPHFIQFDADHFEAYLAQEYAREAAAARHARGERKKPGRMYYGKLTKTFVQVGDEPTDDYKKPVGHALEIVPLSNPCRWRVGSEVAVRVLYEGKPVAGFCVSSGYGGLAPHTFAQNVFTDSKGIARFKLTRPGLWFIRVHHIRRVGDEEKIKADNPPKDKDAPPVDWESFWSSITFRVLDGPAESRPD
jgi:hypothetical protein